MYAFDSGVRKCMVLVQKRAAQTMKQQKIMHRVKVTIELLIGNQCSPDVGFFLRNKNL